MKNFYAFLVTFFIALVLHAQPASRVISGQLTSSDDGGPLPGVNVTIKGTDVGTVTDAQGNYSLNVPIGSTVVFSFIGMQTRELLVTETGMQRVGDWRQHSTPSQWNPQALNDPADADGVTTLTDKTATYRSDGVIYPETIWSIKKYYPWQSKRNARAYFVHSNYSRYTPKGLSLQYTSSIGIDRVGKLPELQHTYAQGRSENGALTWRGPDVSETLNWGPAIKTLEYVDNAYPYDNSGSITTAGSGNGKSVKTFDPYKFFQSGLSTGNELNVFFPGLGGSTVRMDGSRKLMRGVIPGNDTRWNSLSFAMKGIHLNERMTGDAAVTYSNSNGRLMNRGANLASIVGAVMRTSPTFNNAGGFDRSSALVSEYVYRLSDGTIRSSAPGYIDNPFGLVNELPDHERVSRLVSAVGLEYRPGKKLTFNVVGSHERQDGTIVHGVYPDLANYSAGRRTNRYELLSATNFNFHARYNLQNVYRTSSFFKLAYQFKRDHRQVMRTDGFGLQETNFTDINLAESLIRHEYDYSRAIHEVSTALNYRFEWLEIQASNWTYLSNTLSPGKYVNLFPALTVKADLEDIVYVDPISMIRPFVSVSRSIRESPLFFGNNAILSTRLSPDQYSTYFENQEMVWHTNLLPELETKREAGISLSTYFNLRSDISFYSNTTSDMIVPVWSDDEAILRNVATIMNRGVNASLNFNSNYYYYDNKLSWGLALRWTKYRTDVEELNMPGEMFPLAGFNNIQTVVAKGQPLGAIYGTSFQRNENGEMIIGADGFPLVNTNLKMIGSPIPKYFISLEPSVRFKQRVGLTAIIDFKKGGEVWNGTGAALNYQGSGMSSATERTIAGYVYDGVQANGVVNSVPVNFYDPQLPVQQNRWMRNGFAGVGEEHVEDASLIRLNELSLFAKFYLAVGSGKKELMLSFVGKNLLLFTPYTGVDPATVLYGYGAAAGLDFFNAPSVRSYNFQFTIKL